MKIVGRQAVFDEIDMDRYEVFPLDIARWLGIWHPCSRCSQQYWITPDALNYIIPNSVCDTLEKQWLENK